MRILFTKQQPLTAPGGETSHLFALAPILQAKGHEIYLMPVTDTPTPVGIWPREFVRDIRPFGLHPLFDSFAISQAVAAFVKEIQIDAVLSCQYETAYLSTFTGAKNFISGVVADAPFGLLKQKAKSSPLRALAYHNFHFRQLRQADVIFCGSHFAKSELVGSIGISPEKIFVTHLSTDDVFQPPVYPRTGPLRNFIFFGSLEPIKGIFDAIAALGLVAQRGNTDWVFKIAGWGDTDAIMAAARAVEIEQYIQFLGRIERAELVSELAKADLAILPSHTDTFGLSIAEAQACGLPVISYRTGGIPEVVAHGESGILVDIFDKSALAEAIINLVNNPDTARRMGKRGSQLMREKFSWQATTERMLAIISEAKSLKGIE